MNLPVKGDPELKCLWEAQRKKGREITAISQKIKGTKNTNEEKRLWQEKIKLLAEETDLFGKIRNRLILIKSNQMGQSTQL